MKIKCNNLVYNYGFDKTVVKTEVLIIRHKREENIAKVGHNTKRGNRKNIGKRSLTESRIVYNVPKVKIIRTICKYEKKGKDSINLRKFIQKHSRTITGKEYLQTGNV